MKSLERNRLKTSRLTWGTRAIGKTLVVGGGVVLTRQPPATPRPRAGPDSVAAPALQAALRVPPRRRAAEARAEMKRLRCREGNLSAQRGPARVGCTVGVWSLFPRGRGGAPKGGRRSRRARASRVGECLTPRAEGPRAGRLAERDVGSGAPRLASQAPYLWPRLSPVSGRGPGAP